MSLNEEKVNFSLLPITFGLLTSHMFGTSSKCRSKVIDLYGKFILAGYKHGTTFNQLTSDLQKDIIYLTENTPLIQWGLLGQVNPEILKSLNDIRKVISKQRDIAKETKQSFGTSLFAVFKKLKQQKPEFWLPIKSDLANCQIFPKNKQVEGLVKITQALIQITKSACPIVPEETLFSEEHFEDLKNAFLFCEIETTKSFFNDLLEVYRDKYNDYIPLACIYQKVLGQCYGEDLQINLAKWGWLLGYQGSKEQNYKYQIRYSQQLNQKILPNYDFYLNQICSVQQDDNSSLIYKGKDSFSYQDMEPVFKKSIRLTVENDKPYIGCLQGYYITKGNPCGKLLSKEGRKDLFYLNDSLLRVYYLEPTSFCNNREYKNSLFTSMNHRFRAYKKYVGDNCVTKRKFTERPDTRWRPEFDSYLSNLSDYNTLKNLMSTDYSLKDKLSSCLRDEYRVDKATFEELAQWLDHWHDTIKDIENFKFDFSPVKLYKDKKTGRTIHITDQRQKAFEKVCNHLLQVIVQKVNLNVLDGALSNFLPNCSSFIQSGPKIKNAISHREIALANLDVKSCFDNVSLTHPNFLVCLDKSLSLIEQFVSHDARQFVETVVLKYLHVNISRKTFKFEAASKDVKLPKFGTLPTGFVLSPILWYILAIPACYELQKEKQNGNLINYDLCGDDLLVIAEANPSVETKERILKPFFDLADSLGLQFHYWKNYREGKCFYPEKFNHFFKKHSVSPWIDHFPKYSIPIYHAGICVTGGGNIEVVNEVEVGDKAKESLYRKISFIKHHRPNSFASELLVESVRNPDVVVSVGLDSSSPTDSTNQPPRLGEQKESSKSKRTENLKTILYGHKNPVGCCDFVGSINSSTTAINNDIGNKDSSQILQTVPTGFYFIFNKGLQDKAMEILQSKKVVEIKPPIEDYTEKSIDYYEEKAEESYQRYLAVREQIKFCKSTDKTLLKKANLYLYDYAYNTLKVLHSKEPENYLDPFYLERHKFDMASKEYIGFSNFEEFCFVLKQEGLGKFSYIAKLVRDIINNKVNIKSVHLSNFNLNRAIKLVPYALMIETKGCSPRVRTIINEFKKGNPIYPDLSYVYDTDKHRVRLKTSIALKPVERPEVNIINSYLGVNRFVSELSRDQIHNLPEEVKSTLVKTLKKEVNLINKINKISSFSLYGEGERGRRGRIKYLTTC